MPGRGVWHLLAETSVPAAEFARALSQLVPVRSWVPEMSYAGILKRLPRADASQSGPSLQKIQFPLQRGYARLPFGIGRKTFDRIFSMLMESSPVPAESVLVCTSSFWARTAALWPGPVVYYATDLTTAYAGLSSTSVIAADRAMCGVADLVCPNSRRLAEYLIGEAGCARSKIVVLPNATRAANIRTGPDFGRGELPGDVAGLSRPIAGVIGNMGDNIDWQLVDASIQRTPDYHWLFVGPLPRSMRSERNGRARDRVVRSPRAVFLGARPYEELFRYAQAVDVAVMPYNRIEPTFSGSSTRFYEHLAAGRPMLSTRGVEELLTKEPLLTLVDTAEELAQELGKLHAQPADGHEEARCLAGRSETWEARARTMLAALQERTADREISPNF